MNTKNPEYLSGSSPYKYNERYVTEIVRLAEKGMSMLEISSTFNLGENTLKGWAKKYPIFGKAYDQARVKFKAWLIQSIRHGLTDRNYCAPGAALLLRHVARIGDVDSLKNGVEDVKASLNDILKNPDHTADQKCKLVQSVETSVRALETSDAIERIESLEEQVKMADKTRVGKT